MGTRSNIGIENANETITYIYCHWDGYKKHVGQTLLSHYQSPEKIRELMALGDLSSLGPEIGMQHNFDEHVSNWCTAYGRDRAEEKVEARTSSLEDLIENREEFLYVYRLDGKWYFKGNESNDKLYLLTQSIIDRE